MITEKQNVLSFKYGSNADTDYILTLDGREIGRVQELEYARMIEELSSQYQLTKLEDQCEEQDKVIKNLRDDLIELQALYHQSKLKLKRINKITLDDSRE